MNRLLFAWLAPCCAACGSSNPDPLFNTQDASTCGSGQRLCNNVCAQCPVINSSMSVGCRDTACVITRCVFTRWINSWSQHAFIKASNAGAGDSFGSSVTLSIDGDTLAVAGPNEDSSGAGINPTPDEEARDGRALYLFACAGNIWSQQAFVKADNARSGNFFGDSIAISCDVRTLAIGAYGESSSGTGINPATDNASESGAVYTYER